MLDFLKISIRNKKDTVEVYPEFVVDGSEDLMIRGSDFYAIWDETTGLWIKDEKTAIRMIDKELKTFAKEYESMTGVVPKVLYLRYSSTKMIDAWHKYVQKQMTDNYHELDSVVVFEDTTTKKDDYASKKLPYSLKETDISAYEELISTLYEPEERRKIEWAIGSIVAGESSKIQKFLVMYGSAGTGKSTILNIIQDLFQGYYVVFDAKALGSSTNLFAMECFKNEPLVAIQHDGDLSKIEDNTRLNSIVSHEEMLMNEKFRSAYSIRPNAFLFMGTNKPVKITDAKSGIIRRLIDVSPSGRKVPFKKYNDLTSKIKFELGGIALHCLNVYQDDPTYYNNYITQTMLGASNDFYNYVIDSYDVFKRDDGTTLKAAWEMYKTYCNDAKVPYPMSMRSFKEELKNYFKEFSERRRLNDGTFARNLYRGFLSDKFITIKDEVVEEPPTLVFQNGPSLLDEVLKDCPAQLASDKETPQFKWENITTTLKDLDTSKIHYVRVPENHIVIDFDLKDESGNKSFEKNLEAASKWPLTYAELSKGGEGIHLHYIYTGDVSKLSSIYAPNIEIKVFSGKSSLRRKLTKCNDVPIATINSGLPLKGDKKKVVDFDAVKSEMGLRSLIMRNLKKEIHPATAPSVDFINKILDDAYNSGLKYDVTDLRPSISSFAANSSHQAERCLKVVSKMKFKSEEPSLLNETRETPIVFYDVEVFPNLFIICWKTEGHNTVKMINPSPAEVEDLLQYRLVGFNCRRYDNHILYARLMGYNNEQLYNQSQRIINGSKNAFFGEAYNLSYADVYDFSSKKQSLKKFEIELGIHHQELGYRWDEAVPEDKWDMVANYCVNDVIATEAVWKARQADLTARKVLSELSGLPINETTRKHITKILIGDDKTADHVYTNLATGEQTRDTGGKYRNAFPGYEFVQDETGKWHNMYRGTDVGFGGYVYAEPGMYGNVVTLDVGNMHGASIIALNKFGVYTDRFREIREARMAIKAKDFDKAKMMLGGKLAPYLTDESSANDLQAALKLVLNSTYGISAATFDNPLRDPRDKNNIIALRGALFMRTLQDEVQARGYTVAHIKTDSIKIPDATPEIIEFVVEFGKKYGYDFEIESEYEKMCLVNDAVYIAKYKEPKMDKKTGKLIWWAATGTQFQIPYVFKTLFSKEPIEFEDKCETKTVSTALYLDLNEDLSDVSELEKERSALYKEWSESSAPIRDATEMLEGYDEDIAKGHNYVFVGKVGLFCPIKPGCGGGLLLREKSDGGYSAATGSKGYRWLEAETVKLLDKEEDIDEGYYHTLIDNAIASISEYGDFEWFVSDDPYVPMNIPK